jgi:autotransporter-associated beta strand protein
MSHKAWLKGLVDHITKSPSKAARKRPAFSPVALEFLEDRTAPATLDWTGAAGSTWNNPGNWTGGGVPSATNNVLNFNAATATNFTSTNDITGLTGLTINITDASATSGNDFTIGGAEIGITSLSNNKTDAVTSATTVSLKMTGAGATITATAGELAVKNSTNVFDAASSLNVPAGGIATIALVPNSSIGSAQINLTGGTLNIGPEVVAPPTTGFLVGQTNVNNDSSFGSNPNPTYGTEIDLTTTMGNTHGNDATIGQTSAKVWATNNTWFYRGQLFWPNSNGDGTGTLSFGENVDDSVFMWVDGVSRMNNTAWNQPSTSGPITLPTGWHDIDIRFSNGNGGAGAVPDGGVGWSDTFGFGYRQNTGPTDPLASSVDGSNYKVLFADQAQNAPDLVAVRVLPPRVNGTSTNNISVSGASTIALDSTIGNVTMGNLTMASGAALGLVSGVAGQTLTLGTTSLGGDATVNTGSGVVTLTGAVSETAASGLTKTGAGTLNLNAANSYTGATAINAGTVNVVDSGLGTAAGGTTVASGAQLVLKANYTAAEPLTLNGTGTTATNGALTTATSFGFAGPITLGSNAWITASANTLTLTGGITNGTNQLTLAGAGTVTLNTVGITGSGKLVKLEGGDAILNVASPAFTGEINVNAGQLRTSVDGGLGTIAGGTIVGSGASLRFVGPVNYTTLEPITASGPGAGNNGAIRASGGNVTVASDINLSGSTAIGSTVPGGSKFILNGHINLPLLSDLTFVGTGDIDVTQGFGNGNTPTQTNAALSAQYLHNSPNRTGSDLDGVGAAPGNQGLLVAGTPWEGSGLMKSALNFNDPGASAGTAVGTFSHLFNTPGLNIDNFSVYFQGQMNVTTAGTFIFATGNIANLTGLGNPDAQGRIYIDLDKNHIFEDSNNELVKTTGGGTFGDGQEASAPVTLAVGTYDILIPFTNGSGSGGINFSYSSNGGASYQLIDPSSGTVGGASFTNPTTFTFTPVTNVINNNTGRVTLLGNNTYSGTTTVNAGTLVAGNSGALGVGPAGTVVKNGGTLAFTGGIAVANEPVTFNGAGASGLGGAISNISGNNSFTGALTAESLSQGAVSIGSVAGTLTLNGTVDLKYSKLTVGGAGDVIINSTVGGIGATSAGNGIAERIFDTSGGANGNTVTTGASIEERRTRALLPTSAEGILTTQINYTDAQAGGAGVLIASRSAALGGVGISDDTWTGLWVTTFAPNENGPWEFRAFAIDDNVGFFLDIDQSGTFEDAELFGSRTCCGDTGTYSTPALTAGQKYLLGIQLTDTGGGGVIRDAEFRSPSASAASGPWVDLDPSLPANNGRFQVTFVADNSLVKNGAGALTLSGANTYNGNTTITGGTVNYTSATAYGAPAAGSTLTVSGATTVVNLFDNASNVTTVGTADFSTAGSVVNTGAGKLAVKTKATLADGYTVTGDMTLQGANVASNTAPRTLSATTGNLTASKVATSVISSTDNGTLYTNSSARNNTFSYSAPADAEMLVVSVSHRSGTAGTSVSVTYDGAPLTQAVLAESLTGTFVFSSIHYLMFPTTGLGAPLVVDFGADLASNYSVYAYTLKGIDTAGTPITASLNSEGNPTSRSLTLSNVPAGSWGITEGTYRIGNNGAITSTATSGTSLTTGTGGGAGNFWRNVPNDAQTIHHGALVSNLAAGSTTFTSTAAGAAGTRWTFVAAAFAPVISPATVNLPNTNIFLPNGTTFTVDGPGDSVIGTVTHAGNATIQAGTNAPTSLTVGGISSPGGTGILSVNNALGLKFAAGSSMSVDVNGLTVGTNYDQVNVNGAVNLTGASLTVASGFTPAVGNAFTIINNDGTDPVVGTFTGLAQGATVPGGSGSYTISYTGGDGNDVVLTAASSTGTPPTVTSFTVNGTAPGFGGVQRSRVVDLTIVFDQAVQLDADAVTLALHPNVDFGGPQPGGVGALPTITVTPSSDNKTFTVTFSGANTVVDPGADGFQSLKDGVYDYTIVASKVHPLGTPGVSMAANSTGTFHHLFGDINPPTQTGNSLTAVVNTGDNLQFRNAFNKPVGGGYLPYFDVNGDGTINSGDNLQFRNRFNKAMTWTV